jgi:tripartite-type tricarboxylate transporter receptor subunit TctC
VPAGTSSDIVNKLNAAINDGLNAPAMRDSLARVGAVPAPGSPADFAAFIASEKAKWSAIAQTAGIPMQ